MRISTLTFTCLLMMGMSTPTFAAWPERPITIVVPTAPGGMTDIAARLIGEKIGRELKQSVIIDNKGGAGGTIGTRVVANSPNDGYTLLMGNIGPLAINFSLYKDLPYKAEDLLPITNIISVPNVLVVRSESSIESVGDLVKEAKTRPLYASTPGVGQSPHMSTEMFKQRTNIDVTLVPFAGAAPSLTAMLGGQVDFTIDNLPSSLPHIKSGKFRALAVTSGKRSEQLPNVPTMQEAGIENLEVTAWFGLFAPAGTPDAVIQKIYTASKNALNEPDIQRRFHELGGVPGGEPPAEYAEFIDKQRSTWKEIVDVGGIKLD